MVTPCYPQDLIMPCYSEWSTEPTTMASPRSFLETETWFWDFIPDLLSQNLRFNKTSRWFICTFEVWEVYLLHVYHVQIMVQGNMNIMKNKMYNPWSFTSFISRKKKWINDNIFFMMVYLINMWLVCWRNIGAMGDRSNLGNTGRFSWKTDSRNWKMSKS